MGLFDEDSAEGRDRLCGRGRRWDRCEAVSVRSSGECINIARRLRPVLSSLGQWPFAPSAG